MLCVILTVKLQQYAAAFCTGKNIDGQRGGYFFVKELLLSTMWWHTFLSTMFVALNI